MFPYRGYTGKWLYVDLTTGKIEPREMDAGMVETYLGGNGIGTKLLWENVGPDVDALSPENLLIFATGPLTGTLVPNGSRMEVVAKSPLTGIYGDTNTGGFFAPELKFSGWDAVVFAGQSPEPVYLAIQNQHVELRPAEKLWGRTTSETEADIRQAWNDPRVKVACIGPAGENMVRFAAIQFTSQRSGARAGIGAVMGSKRLKAIAVRGNGPVRIADPKRFHKLSQDFNQRIRSNAIFGAVSRYGTPGITTLMNTLGRFPTKNFQFGSFTGIDNISAEALEERAFVRHLSCFGCPVACDKRFELKDGRFAGTGLRSVEYENLNAYGAGVMNDDLDVILYANRFCDEVGMDVMSSGRVIGFAMELWERGILTSADTGGLDIEWGDVDVVLKLMEQVSKREGFGNVLADGVRLAADTIGRGSSEFAMHVKGMELCAQDGRAQKSMGLAHATSSRGADHLKAFPTIDEVGIPDEARVRYGEKYLPEISMPLEIKHKPFLVKDGEDYSTVIDSVGMCKSGGTFVMAELYWEDTAEALEAATGMEMPVDRLKKIGERIVNLQRCYNVWHGITRADDQLPKRFTNEPSPSGNARGSVVELDVMLDEYYQLRDWEVDTGLPKAAKLQELGLEDAVERLNLK
jgi:aldehyde:ferredoxin oxidoreductase